MTRAPAMSLDELPLHVRTGITPRLLSRDDAAAYCGVTVSTFDEWRRAEWIPGPMPGTKRWDRKALDIALDRLSNIAAPSEETWGDFADVGKA